MENTAITIGQQTLFGKKVISSINFDEQELIRDILTLHNNGQPIDVDPTFSTGNFYKNGLPKPKYRFDLYPQVKGVQKADSRNLPLSDNSVGSVMFDPPFVFGVHGQTENNVMAQRFSIFQNWDELKAMYIGSIKEFHRILGNGGLLIFKCQDYTDTKTTFTHVFVHNWAVDAGFVPVDLFVLLAKNRVFNPDVTQRHARKFHSYYWVFRNKKR